MIQKLPTIPGISGLALIARMRTPCLWKTALIAWAISVPLLILAWLDPRLIDGISVWAKPWKFHVSVGFHLFTIALAAALLPNGFERWLKWITIAAVTCTIFELAYITGRGAFGLPSHFAVSTLFTSTMYSLMGVAAVVLTSCAGILGVLLASARNFAHGTVLRWGVGGGLILGTLLGTAAGAYLGGSGGHGIGGAGSEADGLWLFNWARDGGDLRVAHFFGLHATQIIPLTAFIVARYWRPTIALPALAAFSLAYAALTLATFVQALSGRPFFGI
jgi:hypothetical protein